MGVEPELAGQLRAWGWVEHLRSGGTTAWRDWRTPGTPGGRFLPGAQQLELLRQLNTVNRGALGAKTATKVLEASAPGRGRPDLELVGAAIESPFGPRPVDPADLDERELLRVAVGVIADDLHAAGLPETPTGVRAAARPWRVRYRMVGDPWRARQWREHLRAHGRPPGGAAPRIVILGAGLDDLLVSTYTDVVFESGAVPWADWVAGFAARDALPPRADLGQVGQRWRAKVGAQRVRVVLDAGSAARQVGVRRLPKVQTPGAGVTELTRHVAAVLSVTTSPERRAALLRTVLAPRLSRFDDGIGFEVAPEHRDWLVRRAEAISSDLSRADYAVLGPLNNLTPRFAAGAPAAAADGTPDATGVLEVAMRLLTMGGEA